MSQGSVPKSTGDDEGLTVVLPDAPPALTPGACLALLKLLRTHSGAHSLGEVAAEALVVWDEAG